jgi:peptide/nickel transport system substrate-binding protein
VPDEDQPTLKKQRFQRLKKSPRKLSRRFRKLENTSLKHAHTFIIGRWENIRDVRRHAIAWAALVLLLTGCVMWQSFDFSKLYMKPIAAEDTAFSEGVTGTLDTLNPIFANSLAERSAAKLLFDGLLRYDGTNQLNTGLADSWHYEDSGKHVIVTLRPNIHWQDGVPITSKDVIFTVNAVKNADTRSPLYSSWRNVIAKSIDSQTVEFDLPTVYAPFIDSLTLGILPEHLLGTTPAVELRNSSFNRAPVGSGPFEFRDIKTLSTSNSHAILTMNANPDYYLGKPKLSRFYLHAFADTDQLLRSFTTDEINAAVNLSVQDIDSLPANKKDNVHDSPLYDGTFAFFRTTNPILQDTNVRQALRLATNRPAIINKLDDRVRPLEGPLLPAQLTSVTTLPKQPMYNKAAAEKLLDAAGWVKGKDGKRAKAGQPLALTVATARSGDFPLVLEEIAKEWNDLGVTVQTQLVSTDDFQQNVVTPRAYDVLIYELAIGSDPDVYPYWHSSQAGQHGLNLSDYSSGKVDDALDSARSRLEPDLRNAKYRTFYEQWLTDAPAIALYQPTLHYAASPDVTALRGRPIIDAVDRYAQVRYWSGSNEPGFTTP